MSSTKVKVSAYFLILILFIFLLELGSWFILKIIAINNSEVVTDSFIFKPINKDGTFLPNKDSVLPMQENAFHNWTREEFDVIVKINSNGLREDFDEDISEIKVAFFGDSFTFGHGVNVNDRFTNIFAKQNSYYSPKEVVNFSYKSGFQPEHYEFFIRNNNDLNPDYFIIGLYLGNDLEADIKESIYDVKNNDLKLPFRLIKSTGQMRNNPSTLAQPWKEFSKLSNFGTVLIKLIGRTSQRSLLFKDGFDGPNALNSVALDLGETNLALNRAIKSIHRIEKLAKDKNSKLIIVLIAQNFHFSDENPHLLKELTPYLNELRKGNNLLKQVKNYCIAESLTCLDPSPVLSKNDFFIKDAHWNKSGHSKVGKFLVEKLIIN